MINYRQIAISPHPLAKSLRALRRAILEFTLPAPHLLVKPVLYGYIATRSIYHFLLRVFVCEPLFKAYCKQYGRGVHTGIFVHWVTGKGDIIVGDDVTLDGKISIAFAARFSECPTLRIGDGTYISHNCSFTVAKQISIGKHCLIASGVAILDSNGHSTDPAARLAGLPPVESDVQPVHIEDNVWVGQRAVILPGVTIGKGSVIGTCAVVTKDVPPYTVVAGIPAKPLAELQPVPEAAEIVHSPFQGFQDSLRVGTK